MMISNVSRLLVLLFVFNFISMTNSFSQERRGVEMPKIVGSVKSITNFKGWAKNDIGNWYEFNKGFIPFVSNEIILKIDLAKINYERKQYLCLVVYEKYNYTKFPQYPTYFWHIDTTKNQDLSEFDTTQKQDISVADNNIRTRVCQSVMISDVVGYKPVTWEEVLLQMKKCFIGAYGAINKYDSTFHKEEMQSDMESNKILYGNPNGSNALDTYGKFFLKYRYNYKLNKVQFYLGDLKYDDLNNYLTYDDSFLISDPNCKDGNRNLNCRYFEVPKYSFENFFKSILK